MWFVAVAVVAFLVAPCAAEGPSLDYLGEWNLDFEFNDVGGLSGEAFDKENNLYYLVPDGDAPAPVLYKAEVGFGEKGIASIKMFEEIRIQDPNGEAAKKGPYDPEAIAYNAPSMTLYYANAADSEGNPSIREIRVDGSFIRQLSIPQHHRTEVVRGRQVAGVRANSGYQGLAVLEGPRLLVAPRSALIQDEVTRGFGPIRITAYEISDTSASLAPFYEYVYQPDEAPEGWKSLGVAGMAEVPGENSFLVLETFAKPDESEYFSRIYRVDMQNYEPSSVLEYPSLASADYVPLEKSLVMQLDAESLGVWVDKLDRLSFGPDYQGYRILTVASDNDFKDLPRRTQTFAFVYKP